MSHISTAVEYALHCLLFLTAGSNKIPDASAKDLAELQGIPTEYVAKLFTKLNKAGLVIATEGARGGFTLAKRPREIRILDVVDAIDGKKALFECREIRSRCAVFGGDAPAWATQGVCAIHAVMQTAEMRMREVLAQHTLADLAKRAADKAPPAFGPAVVQWLGDRASNRRANRTQISGSSHMPTPDEQ